MVKLQGDAVFLRALEQEDLDFLYQLENNAAVWEISGTLTPYSKNVLQLYLDNAYRDIFDVKQLRLVICDKTDARSIGLVDLFDFDPQHRRAGLGIVILEEADRGLGHGKEAIGLLCTYAFGHLGLRQVYANILAKNKGSIKLFRKLGFEEVGVKKDWIRQGNGFYDEVMFQKINRDVY
ncbi:GNAT family N-acetyltransferase [Maribacter sp. 2307ULW6-5]|uniref:GNAT family N-acetyltransferase n=1 Tax=Maribacter sp. 2307ULW6-5 TaxID=3386275 RepID=UPI0039BD096C